jgi:hypothetical protein
VQDARLAIGPDSAELAIGDVARVIRAIPCAISRTFLLPNMIFRRSFHDAAPALFRTRCWSSGFSAPSGDEVPGTVRSGFRHDSAGQRGARCGDRHDRRGGKQEASSDNETGRGRHEREGGIVAKKDPGPRIKDKDLYERLRGAGVSRKISTRVANSTARIANSAAKVSRKKAAKRGGAARSYDDWKVPDLRRRAKQVGIAGRSAMTKKQLIKALRAS